ncbi:MAG: hypothetical protein HZB56_22350 [Deltaproteobacteria bacterium]|nr:hypothetical protein [Deltaproteobacteria bacterium]
MVLWRSVESTGPAPPRREPRDRVTVSPEAQATSSTGRKLDAAEQAEVRRLEETDQRVRTHERAHQAAGGGAAGAASFTYTVGPDGKLYATGGEVPIRVDTGRTPEEKLAAAQRMRAAALAPADPSAQDLSVAADAAALEAEARAEKSREASQALEPPASSPETGESRSRHVTAYERAVARRHGPDAATVSAQA